MYDQSMDDDSFDLIEKLIGHGGNKKYYENDQMSQKLQNELYAEMEANEVNGFDQKKINSSFKKKYDDNIRIRK